VPVTIASGHLLLLPSPRVIASDITVGKGQELKVVEIMVIPTVSSVFSATKVIDLKISKPLIKQAALEFVSALSGKNSETSSESASINIRYVTIDELQLDWPDKKVPIVNIEVRLTNANTLESAKVETADGALKADVMPKGDEHLILINASKWILPVGLPILIDKAGLEMHLKDSRLEIPNVDVALYSGKLTGNAVVSWEKGWHTAGRLRVENVSVKEPSNLVSKSVYLSGHLFGNGNFSSTAKDAAALADNLRTDFKFSVNNGVLHGLDLVKVASLLIKQGGSGGETAFDEFSGLLDMTGKQYHLRDLKISSGLLAATGRVKIKSNKELDGVAEVELKRSVSLVAIPLEISGTVSNPVVLPSKAALAGAVAGTAILGPGVGTSLGIKAGGAVDKFKGLFQSK
jgi:uncharacterized protein involved in outer membrane biogenesis